MRSDGGKEDEEYDQVGGRAGKRDDAVLASW